MSKIVIRLITICVLLTVDWGLSYAQEESRQAREAREKATKIHRVVESDAVFVQDEIKALYYQNIQIIDLLQQIRELLQQQIEKMQEQEKKA